jgi:hypothetical protein
MGVKTTLRIVFGKEGEVASPTGIESRYSKRKVKMKKILSLVAAAMAFGATAASADPLMKYNYFDVAYQWNDTKGIQGILPTNGVDTKLSISPFENFAFEGGYNYANGDFSKSIRDLVDTSSINYNTWSYGILGYYHWCPGLDFLARVGGNHFNANADIEGDHVTDSADSVYAGVGSRYLLTDTLEVDGNVLYQNANGALWTYSGTALYTILENVALKADAGIDNESSVTLGAGVRLAM